MKMPNFISNIIGGKASDIVESAGNVIDKFVQTKEEKEAARLEFEKEINRHLEEADAQMTEMYALEIKDRESARTREIQIATSDKAPLINKIITPLLALFITAGFFGILGYMLKYEVPKSNERIMDIMLGSLGTAWLAVVYYYVGSSASSSRKQDQLNKIMERGHYREAA